EPEPEHHALGHSGRTEVGGQLGGIQHARERRKCGGERCFHASARDVRTWDVGTDVAVLGDQWRGDQ
ncbi:MAG TPA: hypothetical protein VGA18_07515, partial [Rhodothermales bacterium]